MHRAITLSPLTFSLVALGVAAAIGLAAFLPWVRKVVLQRLGLLGPSQASLAAVHCPLQESDKITDPDRIYFLSCGGIY